MEPRIQYAKTTDGVNIAFWKAGSGPPLVWVPEPLISHLQLEWSSRMSMRAELAQTQGERWSVIAFDPRGLGLSDREVSDLSFDARLLDLIAVVDALGLDRFALAGTANAASIAAAYAATYPERISRVVLVNAGTPAGLAQSPRGAVLETAFERDWEIYTETMGALVFGWGTRAARRCAEFMRGSITHQTALRLRQAMGTDDPAAFLPQVSAPTLLICLSEVTYMTFDAARNLAACAPNASLVVLEGNWRGNRDAVVRAIDEFLGEADQAASKVPAAADVHTILFTDLTESTAITQRLGDAQAQELVRAHNAIVREALRQHGGTEIKHTGDGIMASFPTASGALECAVAIQRAVDAKNDEQLGVHIGLNAGEPVAEESDLFGTAVQLARRICDRAGGGEILVSDVVRQLVAGKNFLFADRGETALRGFEDPVRLYEVRWQEA